MIAPAIGLRAGSRRKVEQNQTLIRERLEQLRQAFQLQKNFGIDELRQQPRCGVADASDDVDSSVDADVLAMRLAFSAYATGAIERSLRRLAQGEYGRCEDCDQAIGAGRLVALPFATRCLECQRALEADGSP